MNRNDFHDEVRAATDKIEKACIIGNELFDKYSASEKIDVGTAASCFKPEAMNSKDPDIQNLVCWACDYGDIQSRLGIITDYVLEGRNILRDICEAMKAGDPA